MTDETIMSEADLHAILGDVAANKKAPAHARVSAARALLRGRRRSAETPAEAEPDVEHPAITWLRERRAKASDPITCAGEHRGVGLHDQQPKRRIDQVVRPAIDAVFAAEGVDPLLRHLEDSALPPEARLLAWAKLEVIWRDVAANRERRPAIDMDRVRAFAAGLDSEYWRDPAYYTSLLDAPGPHGPRAMRRETRLREPFSNPARGSAVRGRGRRLQRPGAGKIGKAPPREQR